MMQSRGKRGGAERSIASKEQSSVLDAIGKRVPRLGGLNDDKDDENESKDDNEAEPRREEID